MAVNQREPLVKDGVGVDSTQLIQKKMMNSDDQDLNTEEAWWYICVITRALYNSLHEVRMKQQCYTVHTHPKEQ